MLEKTGGIVLHSLKYGETSVIVRTFTRELGLQSYLIPGVRKHRSRNKLSLFQPLNILEMVVYHKQREGLQRIKEIRCPRPFETIPYHISKTSIALFLAEMLSRSMKSPEPQPALYDFISKAIVMLDETQGKLGNFHLVFLLELSRFLGFQPSTNHDASHPYFNLPEGTFQSTPGPESLCMNQEISRYFFSAIQSRLQTLDTLSIPSAFRKTLLQYVIDYYRHHLDGMPEIKSHQVLEMVLSEKA